MKIPDTTGHQMTIQVPTSPNVCFCTTSGNRTSEMCLKMNKEHQ